MKLWQILKEISLGKVEQGTKFKADNLPINLIIEFDGSDLVYNTLMNDTITRNTVSLCSGEINANYEEIREYSDEEIKNALYYGLPDSRICNVAEKVVVITSKGTEIEIKRAYGFKEDGVETVSLTKPVRYEDLPTLIRSVDKKIVIIRPSFYRRADIRNMLMGI